MPRGCVGGHSASSCHQCRGYGGTQHHLHPLRCTACCTVPRALSSANLLHLSPVRSKRNSSLLASSTDDTAHLHLIHKVQTNTYKSNWIPECSVQYKQLGRTHIHSMGAFRVKTTCTDTWHQVSITFSSVTNEVRLALKHLVYECESKKNTTRSEKIQDNTEVFPNQRSAQHALGFRETLRNLHTIFFPTNMHIYIYIYIHIYEFLKSCYTNISYI